jgi:Ca-activated chloride channel homolog
MRAPRRRWLWLAVAVLVTGFGIGDLERGNRHYRAGRYAEAVDSYLSALRSGRDSPQLRYNLGTALIQLGRYDQAVEQFQAALAGIEPELRQRALYNMGTTLLHAGREADDDQARQQLLAGAVEALKQTLRLGPTDVDAKWNLELALREQDEPPPSGGGGGGQDQDQDRSGPPGGGQAQADPREGQGDQPLPTALTPEEAERILAAVEQDERQVYRDQLRRGQRDTRVLRDW